MNAVRALAGFTPEYVRECDGERDCSDGSHEVDCVKRGLAFECDDGELVYDEDVRCDRFDLDKLRSP